MWNNLLVKCSHCKEILSQDQFDSHKCRLQVKACREIPVVYYREDSNDNEKSVTAWGLDNILYTFEVVPRKPIPITLPLADEFSQHEKQPKNSQNPVGELTHF
jgi:hypothetical protein